MVGEAVVGFGDADFRVGAGALFEADEDGGDAGGVGLEGEGHEFEHEPGVLGHVGGDAVGGGFDALGPGRCGLFGGFDALFEFADGVEIFGEFALVGAAERGGEKLGFAANHVENAFLVAGFAGVTVLYTAVVVAEEAFEDGAGADFSRVRGRGGPPGDGVGVGAAVAVVAAAALHPFFAAEFEGGETGFAVEAAGRDLIDRDAGLQVATVGLFGVDAGEVVGTGATVITGTVAEGPTAVVGEAGEHEDVVAEGLEGLADAGEVCRKRDRASCGERCRGGHPLVHDDAVGNVEERGSGGRCGGGSAGERRDHGIEERQGQACA